MYLVELEWVGRPAYVRERPSCFWKDFPVVEFTADRKEATRYTELARAETAARRLPFHDARVITVDA